MRIVGLASVLALVATSAACNVSQDGDQGNIRFTPSQCGRIGGCDFEDSVGVGGRIAIQIEGLDGFSTAGVTLEAADPQVLTLEAIGDLGGRPAWEATAVGAGVSRVIAYDTDDNEVDSLDVPVQDLIGLTLENFVGDAVGPMDDSVYDQVWSVNADAEVSFYVTPLIAGNAPTMGVYDYIAVVDQVLDTYMLEGSDPAAGYIYFRVPAGSYTVDFENDVGTTLSVLINAQ
jgi:hypothetical protein